jgi:hypothetical protein
MLEMSVYGQHQTFLKLVKKMSENKPIHIHTPKVCSIPIFVRKKDPAFLVKGPTFLKSSCLHSTQRAHDAIQGVLKTQIWRKWDGSLVIWVGTN